MNILDSVDSLLLPPRGYATRTVDVELSFLGTDELQLTILQDERVVFRTNELQTMMNLLAKATLLRIDLATLQTRLQRDIAMGLTRGYLEAKQKQPLHFTFPLKRFEETILAREFLHTHYRAVTSLRLVYDLNDQTEKKYADFLGKMEGVKVLQFSSQPENLLQMMEHAKQPNWMQPTEIQFDEAANVFNSTMNRSTIFERIKRLGVTLHAENHERCPLLFKQVNSSLSLTLKGATAPGAFYLTRQMCDFISTNKTLTDFNLECCFEIPERQLGEKPEPPPPACNVFVALRNHQPHLKRLSLKNITDTPTYHEKSLMDLISSKNKLESLTYSGRKLCNATFFNLLTAVGKSESLTWLKLVEDDRDPLPALTLTQNAKPALQITKLEHLECSLTSRASTTRIIKLLPYTHLKSLSLWIFSFGEDIDQLLTACLQKKSLESFHLASVCGPHRLHALLETLEKKAVVPQISILSRSLNISPIAEDSIRQCFENNDKIEVLVVGSYHYPSSKKEDLDLQENRFMKRVIEATTDIVCMERDHFRVVTEAVAKFSRLVEEPPTPKSLKHLGFMFNLLTAVPQLLVGGPIHGEPTALVEQPSMRKKRSYATFIGSCKK